MRIGLNFEASTKSGGAYQYALNLIEALKKIPEHEYVIFNISPDFPYHLVKLPNWKVIDLIKVARKEKEISVTATENMARDLSFRRRFNLFVLEYIQKLHLYRLEIFLTSFNAKRRAKRFNGHGIDVMLYHGPSELSFLTDIPGIVPVHDIEHRLHKKGDFPELSGRGQYTRREYLYKHIAERAFKILVDSPVSREDISREYGVDTSRITVVPFVPPIYLKKEVSETTKEAVRKRYKLPDKFVFYPAQLWPHKNHRNIVLAVAALKRRGIRVDAVFSGSLQDLWGEYKHIQEIVRTNGIEDRIHFLGFVNADEISALYAQAQALVMPVLIGPTFIPVYEAWYMGCPVIYSDIRGPREQAGNAALLVNPRDPEDIAEKIYMLWTNKNVRQELIEKGCKRLASWTWQDFCTSIRTIIDEFKTSQHRSSGD